MKLYASIYVHKLIMTSSCYLAMDNNVFQKWHGFSHVTLLELWDPLYFFSNW